MIDITSDMDDQFRDNPDELDDDFGLDGTPAGSREDGGQGSVITDGEPLSVDEVFSAMEEGHFKAAEALRERWGEDAEENIQFAQSAAKELLTPGLHASLEEAGVTGNPDFIELAARIGRQMVGEAGDMDPVLLDALSDSARDQLEDQHADLTTKINDALDRGDPDGAHVFDDARRRVAQRIVGQAVSRSPVDNVPSRRASLEDRHTRLTRALHDALDRGDQKEVQRLDRARTAVARKLVSDGPIVGQLTNRV